MGDADDPFSIISGLFRPPPPVIWRPGGQPTPPTTYDESPFSVGRDPATNVVWQNGGNASATRLLNRRPSPKSSHPAPILERAEGWGDADGLFSAIQAICETRPPAWRRRGSPPPSLKRRRGRGRPGPFPRPTAESWRRLPPAGRGRPRSASPATFPGFPPLGGRGECSGRP